MLFQSSYCVGVEILAVTIVYRFVMGLFWATFYCMLNVTSMGLNIVTTSLGKLWFVAIGCAAVIGAVISVAAQLRGYVMVRSARKKKKKKKKKRNSVE
jgi:hypothetical protein